MDCCTCQKRPAGWRAGDALCAKTLLNFLPPPGNAALPRKKALIHCPLKTSFTARKEALTVGSNLAAPFHAGCFRSSVPNQLATTIPVLGTEIPLAPGLHLSLVISRRGRS